jgi:hypothetical protein
LWGFTSDVLTACGIERVDAEVMMVTHLPLVEAVAGGQPQDGEIYEVGPEWQNPKYMHGFERMIGQPDRW